MRTYLLYISLSLIIFSCSSKRDSQISLFNDVSFQLNQGEKAEKIDAQKKEIFNAYIDPKSIQIPLFRSVVADSFKLFIGIPYNTTLKNLTECKLVSPFEQTNFEGDSTQQFYKSYKNDRQHVVMYARNFENNLVFILVTSKSKRVIDSLFNHRTISSRFKIKA
jgi:hypothetical protein